MPAKDMLRHELIGSDAEVIRASNKSLEGLKGRIIDETKNTLVLETNDKTRRILKKNITMKIKMKKQTIQVEGNLLVGRPEDRLKKRIGI
ncbi:MAG TPA: ribonuclease P protein subunit [Candidatus Nanoarchaeia archaeon]|nr:ribonuclease P protein subunit [Candidatus Nanoarchaeia archaeon]